MCGAAVRSCKDLLEEELCKVALTCYFSLDVLYLCQEWVVLFLEFSELCFFVLCCSFFFGVLPSWKGCNSTERVVMGDSTGIVMIQTS